MNDTVGPDGLVPTLLVFGVLARTLDELHELPDQKERLRVIETAKKKFAEIVAQNQ